MCGISRLTFPYCFKWISNAFYDCCCLSVCYAESSPKFFMDTQFNSKYPHYLFWHFLYRHRLGKTLNYTSNLLKIVPCHFIWVKGLNMPINFSYQMFWPAILSKMTWQFIGLLLFHLWFLEFCNFNSKLYQKGASHFCIFSISSF